MKTIEQRLIDANELKIDYGFTWDDITPTHDEMNALIDRQPTVDAVPVCRCKDCKYNIGEKVWLNGEVTIDCANGMGYPQPNWFCADGERRTE